MEDFTRSTSDGSGGNTGLGSIFQGIGEGFKNAYNIKMANAQLQMAQDKNDSDIAYQKAAADKMENEGSISGLEADQMRDLIANNKKSQQAQLDNIGMIQDNKQDRIHKALGAYIDALQQVGSTPDGQQAIGSYLQQRNQAINPNQQPNQSPNPVVNTIMPGVGANNQPQGGNGLAIDGSNLPILPAAGGQSQGTQSPQQPVMPPQGGQPPLASSSAQPSANAGQAGGVSGLPPITDLYQGLSKAPFGSNVNDLYMKNPNVMEAMKNGSYMIKKEPSEVEAENPLYLNENDRTVLNDTPDLKKAGYDPKDIFQQLTPGTQTLINTVGQYKATPAELTSSFGGGRQKQELVKAVQQFYPGWNDAIYDERHKTLLDYGNVDGKNGQAIQSTRQGIEHMDELTQSIDAVSNKTLPIGNRQVPLLNAPMNAIMQYVGGDPDILALKQNINAVSEEMTKAWGGTNAGEGRLKNWRDTMNATNSPQGWSGLLSKTAKLWQDAADTRESMFSFAMGGQKMQDFLGEGVLQPHQQQILDRIKNGYTPGQNNQDAGNYAPQDLQAEMRKRGFLK